MLKKNKEVEISTIIGKGTIIEGNIVIENGIKIEGKVKGNIKSKGIISIIQDGHVEGDIEAADCIIAGTLSGNVLSENTVEIEKTAKVTGDIVASLLSVYNGAILNGSCKMSKNTNDLKNSLIKKNSLSLYDEK